MAVGRAQGLEHVVVVSLRQRGNCLSTRSSCGRSQDTRKETPSGDLNRGKRGIKSGRTRPVPPSQIRKFGGRVNSCPRPRNTVAYCFSPALSRPLSPPCTDVSVETLPTTRTRGVLDTASSSLTRGPWNSSTSCLQRWLFR